MRVFFTELKKLDLKQRRLYFSLIDEDMYGKLFSFLKVSVHEELESFFSEMKNPGARAGWEKEIQSSEDISDDKAKFIENELLDIINSLEEKAAEKEKATLKAIIRVKELRLTMKADFISLDKHFSDQQKGVDVPSLQKEVAEDAELIELPTPESCELKENDIRKLIGSRISRRKFKDEMLKLSELSYLLWATQGIKELTLDKKYSKRTVPSGGSRHPFETYLAVFRVEGLKQGIYRYLPVEHKLVFLKQVEDLSEKCIEANLGQKFAGKCAVTFFWSVLPYRCEWRYTTEAKKIILQDSGHVCQNLYLACESVGCGTCAIGAYDQELSDKLLDLNGNDEFVVYIAPVGRI